jgi:hypothetical protein
MKEKNVDARGIGEGGGGHNRVGREWNEGKMIKEGEAR